MVVAVSVPEAPVMMSGYWPKGAVLPAVTVSVLAPVAGLGEKPPRSRRWAVRIRKISRCR